MRIVAKTKPHIFLGASGWWCCMTGYRMGLGDSALSAYDDWVARNGGAA